MHHDICQSMHRDIWQGMHRDIWQSIPYTIISGSDIWQSMHRDRVHAFSLDVNSGLSHLPAFGKGIGTKLHIPLYSLLEPVGSAAPKFSLENDGSKLTRLSLTPVSLSCPAQGSPVPSFRYKTPRCVKF